MKLKSKALNELYRHYTGNCVSCDRCSFYEAIDRGEPGAVEAYVKYMKDEQGVTVPTEPS